MPTTENEKVSLEGSLVEKVALALGWTYAKEWRHVGTWVAPNGTMWAKLPAWDTDEGLALQLIKDEEYEIHHYVEEGKEIFVIKLYSGDDIDFRGEMLATPVCEAFLYSKADK